MLIASTLPSSVCHGNFFLSPSHYSLVCVCHTWLLINLADFLFIFFLKKKVLINYFPICLVSYQLRIECMLLCEETLSVLDMLKPKVKLVEEACHCE